MEANIEALKREIDRQLQLLKNQLEALPAEREIRCTLTGDPALMAAMLTLDVIKQALAGDDYYLQHLVDFTHPLQSTPSRRHDHD